jgi:hypothetical protein
MQRGTMRRTLVIAGIVSVALFAIGCSGKQPAPSAPCDQECKDAIALRALREAMRSAFTNNVAYRDQDNGPQDEWGHCDKGVGSSHIFGTAVSNKQQGMTKVNLTYEFLSCLATRVEATPELNYNLSLKGTVTEVGTLSTLSTSPPALKISTLGARPPDGGADAGGEDGGADAGGEDGGEDGGADGGGFSTLSFIGTLYDPPVEYHETVCEILAMQNGNNVSGWICGRIAGYGQ